MRGRHVHRLDSFNSCRESNTKASIRLLVRVDQMLLEVLGHPETLLPLCAKDSLHGFVRSEELLVGRVLQVLFLEVCPQLLDHLRPRHLLALLGPDDLGKLRGDVEGHLKASQLLLSFLGHGS